MQGRERIHLLFKAFGFHSDDMKFTLYDLERAKKVSSPSGAREEITLWTRQNSQDHRNDTIQDHQDQTKYFRPQRWPVKGCDSKVEMWRMHKILAQHLLKQHGLDL